MQLPLNPANANLSRDFANYKDAFTSNPAAKAEIRQHLITLFPLKYLTSTPDPDFITFPAYQDFFFNGSASVDRLGGKLGPRPASLDSLPNPTPGSTFAFPRNDHIPPPVPPAGTVTIRVDGAILHNAADVPNPHDQEASEHYMHHVLDDILYETRDLLEEINLKLAAYATTPDKVTREEYTAALMVFEDFKATLRTRSHKSDNDYSRVFNWVTIDPVVTAEGYSVSVRVEVNWKNPYHSSSTVRVE